MGAMCSKSSETPLGLDSNNKSNSNDPLVPKVTLNNLDEVLKKNPYNFTDDLYLLEIEREKIEKEK
jgi:hypothetical protein